MAKNDDGGHCSPRVQAAVQSFLESRNAADACSLSQVLESEVSETYFLSARAAAGILRRAERRGKELPEQLRSALQTLAQTGTE